NFKDVKLRRSIVDRHAEFISAYNMINTAYSFKNERLPDQPAAFFINGFFSINLKIKSFLYLIYIIQFFPGKQFYFFGYFPVIWTYKNFGNRAGFFTHMPVSRSFPIDWIA